MVVNHVCTGSDGPNGGQIAVDNSVKFLIVGGEYVREVYAVKISGTWMTFNLTVVGNDPNAPVGKSTG